MKLSVDKNDLQRGLGRIQAIVEKRNSMPILANVLLTASGKAEAGRLELAATDRASIWPAPLRRSIRPCPNSRRVSWCASKRPSSAR